MSDPEIISGPRYGETPTVHRLSVPDGTLYITMTSVGVHSVFVPTEIHFPSIKPDPISEDRTQQ